MEKYTHRLIEIKIVNVQKIPGFYIDQDIIDAYNDNPEFY